MNKNMDHRKNLTALRRVEGQIRGIQKMIDEQKYCVDILVQLQASIAGLSRIRDKVLESHLKGCVASAFEKSTKADRKKKIEEISMLLKQTRRM